LEIEGPQHRVILSRGYWLFDTPVTQALVSRNRGAMNIQLGNVGNLGDILKHAALIQLCGALRQLVGNESIYIETHAYLLSSSIADTQDWRVQSSRLAETYAGYHAYVEREAKLVQRGMYRCSAGLALDVLSPISASLAEIDHSTRRQLKRQLREEDYSDSVVVTESADRLPEVIGNDDRIGFLMLVDPFETPLECWSTVLSSARAVQHAELVGAIEVFAYGDEAIDWPSPPTGFKGPIATVDQLPFHLAVYATALFEKSAKKVLEDLGWICVIE